MKTSLVRQDEHGLYIHINGGKKRPGEVAGYSHVYRMDSGGLKAGDHVTARHIAQSPLAKIMCYENGKAIVLHWHSED